MRGRLQQLFALCIVVLTHNGSGSAQNSKSIPLVEERPFVGAGYLPNYRVASWSGQTTGLSDLIYFGLPMPKDGRFNRTSISNEHLALLAKLKSEPKLRVLLTVGGWDKSSGFRDVVADAEKSNQFIRDAAEFCVRFSFMESTTTGNIPKELTSFVAHPIRQADESRIQ